MLYTVTYTKSYVGSNIHVPTTIKNCSFSSVQRYREQYESGKKFKEYGTNRPYVMSGFNAEKQIPKKN